MANSAALSVVIQADGEIAMIKLRVEWHRECLTCGTGLVVDFLDACAEVASCAWCGSELERYGGGNGDLRDYVTKAVRQLEDTANNAMAVKG